MSVFVQLARSPVFEACLTCLLKAQVIKHILETADKENHSTVCIAGSLFHMGWEERPRRMKKTDCGLAGFRLSLVSTFIT